MIYDELIEELALTLLTKARYEGCISVIDGFSQCEEDKTRIEYPVDAVMRIMPVGSEIWPEECEPLLKKIGAETIGDVADYLNKNESENSSADDVLSTALLKIDVYKRQLYSLSPKAVCIWPRCGAAWILRGWTCLPLSL